MDAETKQGQKAPLARPSIIISKHTPGPWRLEPGSFAFSFRIYGTNGEPVADTCDVSGAQYNAKLIAAAPALADALNLALRMLEEIPARAWQNGTSDGGYPDDGEVMASRAFDDIRAALRLAGRLP